MRETAQIVAVEDQVAGDELVLAAASGTKLLTLTDATHFNETGGGTLELDDTNGTVTVLAYASADLELNTVTMAANLAATWPIGTQVRVSPHEITRVAYVQPLDGDDDGELVSARVPFSLRDRVPVNERTGGYGEVIEMERVGYTFVVADVLGSLPVIDVDAIPVDDIVIPPPTDVVPPDPILVAPDVKGAIGALVVSWVSIVNNDPVTYDVHVSTVSGFTADASNLVGSTTGNLLWVKALTGGALLEYAPVVYYAKVIARDKDGSAAASPQGSGSALQVNHEDIAVDAVQATNILAESIIAEKLLGFLVLASTIATGPEPGQRVEMDANGIILYDNNNVPIVKLPTDPGANPFFHADSVETYGIDIFNFLTLRGAGTLEPAATLTMKNGQSDPATSPTLTTVWDTQAIPWIYNDDPGQGMEYDPSGTAAGGVPTFWLTKRSGGNFAQEFNAATGAPIRSIAQSLATPTSQQLLGITRLGSNIFTLGTITGTNRYYLNKWQQTPGVTFMGSADITSQLPISLTMRLGLGNDGTNLIVVGPAADSGSYPGNTRIRLRAFEPTGLTFVSNTDLDAAFTVQAHNVPAFYGYEKITEGGTPYHFIPAHLPGNSLLDGVFAFLVSTGAHQGNMHFPSNGTVRGIAHDGTQFWTQSQANQVTKHSGWVYTTESPVYWGAYTWKGGGFETKKSPSQKVTQPRRAKLRVAVPDFPASITSFGFYMDRGASEPTLDLQTSPTSKSVDLSTFSAGGAAPPATSTFVGSGGGAAIRTQNGEVLMRANGIPRCRLEYTLGQNVSDSNELFVRFGTESVDTDGFHAATTDAISQTPDSTYNIVMPFTGQYQLIVTSQFAGSSVGRRDINIQLNGSPNLIRHTERAHTEAGVPFRGNLVYVADLTAGDYIRVSVFQSSGAALALANCRITISYLGPN